MKTITVTPIAKNCNNITCKENNAVEIEFEALQEDISPDEQLEEPYLSKFLKKLKNDSDYQYCGVSANWFCAHVTVRFKHFEAEDYLGACSYKSYDEFCKYKGEYFTDMVNTCVDQINAEIETCNANIQNRWNLRKDLIAKGQYQFFLDNMDTLKSY